MPADAAGNKKPDNFAAEALTTTDALGNELMYIILHKQLLVVVIYRQNGATLTDVIVQLLHLWFHLCTRIGQSGQKVEGEHKPSMLDSKSSLVQETSLDVALCLTDVSD